MSDDGHIRLLDDAIIDQIAAGEVIERPASVVKELVENALDAGATQVDVELSAGGLRCIRVTDDGCGMSPEDLRRCVLRHATSKLRAPEDLFALHTLGFRGEALSSIAVVSRLTMTTRGKNASEAHRMELEGGQLKDTQAVGAPVGTTVEVRDLFFNTPARRAFMRAPATEQTHVVTAVQRVFLGARRGGVSVQTGGRKLLALGGEKSEIARVRNAIATRDEPLFRFKGDVDGVRVEGFLSSPEHARRDSRGLWIFVNGRFVKDRMLQRAVLDAYRDLLQRGSYPVVALYVDVDPAAVDVNVHPQKLEVRFGDTAPVFRAVNSTVMAALAQAPWQGESNAIRRDPDGAERATERFFLRAQQTPKASFFAPRHEGPSNNFETRDHEQPRGSVGSSVGVGRFVLIAQGDKVWLVDGLRAAAAHVGEQWTAQGGALDSEILMFPESMTLEDEALGQRLEALGPLGFDVEALGPGQVVVRAVPKVLSSCSVPKLTAFVLEQLAAGKAADVALIQEACALLPPMVMRQRALERMERARGGEESSAVCREMTEQDLAGLV